MGVLHRAVPNHKFSQIFLKEWTIATNYCPEYSPHRTNFRSKFRVALTLSRNMSLKVGAVQNNTCLENSQNSISEVSFRSRIRRKARNFVELRRQMFALLLHNTVFTIHLIKKKPVSIFRIFHVFMSIILYLESNVFFFDRLIRFSSQTVLLYIYWFPC